MTDAGAPLRVHFVVHHHLSEAGGVTGATRALGMALGEEGCEVSYYSFDDAFGAPGGREVARMMRFPWKVRTHLARASAGFDVIDASTGDAWLWGWGGRPGNRRAGLVTRSHGLEHVASDDVRERARRGQVPLSWKYPLYHGGYRLWEVCMSLVYSDAQVFLNEIDRTYATTKLGVNADTAVVVPNALHELLLGLPAVEAGARGGMHSPIALAFIGNWVALKGIRALVEMTSALHSRGVPFSMRMLGTGTDASTVLGAFAPDVRDRLTVQPRFAPPELAGLLRGADVIVQPSWTEGYGLALVEGMACGLAPIATRVGVFTTVVQDGENGLLMADESGVTLANCVMRLASDRDDLLRMRRAAQASVQALNWNEIALRTIRVYREAIGRR